MDLRAQTQSCEVAKADGWQLNENDQRLISVRLSFSKLPDGLAATLGEGGGVLLRVTGCYDFWAAEADRQQVTGGVTQEHGANL